MASGKREDARIEKAIRALLKLPGNKRCMNCNLLGPQYVCTTFSTFVCTSCSGIHREFTHRVKSVSMAKFTSEEVDALEKGGNERAKQIYFKEWDPQRHSYPDSNNIHKLRGFIKHVYVDRKFTGEKGSENLPRIRMTEKEESFQSGKSSSFRFESKSSDREDRFDRHIERSSPSVRSDDKSHRFYYDERRSPRYTEKYSRNGNVGRKPAKFEVVDDRFKDEEYRNRRLFSLESRLKQLQPGGQKNVAESQTPAAAPPSKEVPKEKAPSPQVVESPQTPKQEAPHDLPQNKVPDAAAEPETQAIPQPIEDNWATFDSDTVEGNVSETSNSNTLALTVTEITPKATYTNPVDLLLFELSGALTVTTSVNDPTTAVVDNASPCRDFQQFPPTPVEQTTASPNNSDALELVSNHTYEMDQTSNAVPSHVELYDRDNTDEVSSMQFSRSVSVGSSSSTQPTSTSVTPIASNDMLSDVVNSDDSPSAFTELSPQTTSKPVQDTKPCAVETKSSARVELPADLFTTRYLSSPEPHAGWHNVQPHGLGYGGMQYYPNAAPPSAFPIAAKSTNPFDGTAGRTLHHTSSLPTLADSHGALPGVSPRTGIMHASSYGSLGMEPHPTSYGSPVHSQSPFESGFPTGSYFGQVNNHMHPPRPERVASFNDDRSAFGSLGTMQPLGGEYMAHNSPNSFPKMGGNPFGDI